MRLVALMLSGLLLNVGSALAAPVGDKPDVSFNFQAVNVAQVVGLVYMDALKVPFVVAPEVLKDERVVSFRFDPERGDFRQFWRAFLDSLGLAVETRNGVDFVGLKKPLVEVVEPTDFFVYRPLHRSVRYLVDVLGPAFSPGAFSVQRAVKPALDDKVPSNPPPRSASAAISVDSDVLLFNGTDKEIARFKRVLPVVDTSVGEVLVKAIVYEVTTGASDGSAFSLALSLLGGRLGVSVGSSVGPLDNALSIKTGSIDAVISAFQGDSRFKAVSTPSLRVKSGSRAELMVGQEVPTLGSVSYQQGSSVPVQSVEYRSSGVILALQPTVRDAGVEMLVEQQISDFATTRSGVNNSPTLTKRSLSTSVTAQDGELIVLGGLTQDKASSTSGGQSFLPKFMRSSGQSSEKTEVLLMLQVTKL